MTPLVLFEHEMFALQRYGGITRIFIELLRRLAGRDDINVAWHRGFHADAYDVTEFLPRLRNYWGLPATRVVPGLLTDGSVNRASLTAFVKQIGAPADVLHPSYYDPAIPDAAPHRKLAITVHDMIPEIYFGDLPRFAGLLEGKARLVRRADLIFVNSEHTRHDLLRFFPGVESRIRLTPWASCMREVVAAPVPALVGTLRRPFLLYVGTRSKYKNFQVLADAFAQVAGLRTHFDVVAFGGTGPFLEHEQRFFAEHGLTTTFHYLDGRDDVLKSLYEKAAALVYTSRYEGFGLPPLEAMECGCPVVCCRTSSLPEVVGDVALFFGPDAPEELAANLARLATDGTVATQLRTAGPKRATVFSWERTVELTVRAYREVAS